MSADDPIWNNQTNQKFYENEFSELILKERAHLVGLDDNDDLNAIYQIIGNNTSRLLEVGGGYGRIIEYLIQKKFAGDIFVIEKSKVLYELLTQKYNNLATIYHDDIILFQTLNRYDAILSMWSGVSDFTIEEQPQFIQQLANLLTPTGKIFLDIFICNQSPLASSSMNNKFYKITSKGFSVQGYLPSEEEIQVYCKISGLQIINIIKYQTKNSKERQIYVLQKTSFAI